MSLSPDKILLRLQELQIWQARQEKLLDNKINKSEVSEHSNSETIDDLMTVPNEKMSDNKPKKAYLKKGSGLVRFRMKPDIILPVKVKKSAKFESKKLSPLKVPKSEVKLKGVWHRINDSNEEKLNEIEQNARKIEEYDRKIKEIEENAIIDRQFCQTNAKNNSKLSNIRENDSALSKVCENGSAVSKIFENDTDLSKVCRNDSALSKIRDNDSDFVKLRQIIDDNNVEIGDQTLELLLFEALEQKTNNSSFCSTNSSVLQLIQSTPKKLQKNLQEKFIIQEEDNEKIQLQEWQQEVTEFSDEEKWSTTTDDDSTISSNDLESTMKSVVIEKHDMACGTSDLENECKKCLLEIPKIIKEKNEEIEEIRKHFKKEITKKMEQYERELNKKIKEYDNEKLNFKQELEMEKKKFAKEKLIFEKHIKERDNRPNRKEREEICNLKKELSETKELLKLKETKNGTTQARLRTQIKQLEKQNEQLKNDLVKLTKENSKLLAMQKLNTNNNCNNKKTDTKMLHEINKNLTKLTEETRKNNQIINKNEETAKIDNSNKENSIDMTNFHNLSYLTIEKQYRDVFGNLKQNLNDTAKKSEKTEELLEDGTKVIQYKNGNHKTITSDGNLIVMKYFNGDIKETNLNNGIIKYFYKEQKIWTTNFPDGSELIEFANGQSEKHYKDGKCEIFFNNNDNCIQTIHPNGKEEIKYSDGSKLEINGDERILYLPNGQKEIHTKNSKRREYPDGTIKMLYNNGTQETRYANGRIRIKDPDGNLIMDNNCDS